MIVIDTSVWIDVNRRPASERAEAFRQLLDLDEVALALPVRLELLSGVSRRQRPLLERGLSSLPLLHPTDETWEQMARWLEPAADAGQHFAISDLLIAALAHDITGLVWSLDRDFTRMATLGMVRLYE